MVSRVVGLVAFCLLAPSAGIRKSRGGVGTNSTEVASNVDCRQLNNVDAGGQNWGEGLELVCRLFPGRFPVSDINRARELFTKATEPGGTWDQIKAITENHNGKPFCWRNETTRVRAGRPCEMESGGVCYGACPWGFKPARLIGRFMPMCTSVCGATTHPVTCGFGCATTRMNCVRTLLSQVGEVAKAVGAVIEIITGDDRLANLADAVIKFSEFLLGVLPDMIDAVKGGIDILRDNEQGVMVLVLLFQYVKEKAPEIGESVNSIKEAFNELVGVISELMEEREETGSISVGKVIRSILENGEDLLDMSVRLTKAFSFGRCSVHMDDVKFTVEEVGDERWDGPYRQNGEKNNRPRYTMKIDTSRTLEFSTSAQRWTFVKRNRFGWKTYVYRSSQTLCDYPVGGWSAMGGAASPMPEIISVQPRKAGC